MTSLRLLLLSLFLAMAVAPRPASADALPKVGRDKLQAELPQLLSSDPGGWREASAWFALGGPAGLDLLEQQTLTDANRAHVKEALGQALLLSVTWAEVAKHPRLRALAEPEVQRGLELAKPLDKEPLFQPACPGPGRHHEHSGPPPLQELGGFAVPAAEWLLRQPAPHARANGIELLLRVGAYNHRDQIASLAKDGGKFDQFDCDVVLHRTVGEVAKTLEDTGMRSGEPPYIHFEQWAGMPTDLINATRTLKGVTEATTYEQWWDLVRPLWRQWWTLAGANAAPPREAWKAAMYAAQGYAITFKETRGKHAVTVEGPRGTTAELRDQGKVVASGPVPLTLTLKAPTNTIEVRAHRPDGSEAQVTLACCSDRTMTFKVLDAPGAAPTDGGAP